ncbi:GNAT family N-acetyltransferase [soil metagenome]
MVLAWRAMFESDLDRVAEIAGIAFPDHFEGRPVFANRLSLYPQGCFVLASGDGPPLGYLVAYPWVGGTAPVLNTLISSLPETSNVTYLHDLALHPDARGGGWTRAIVESLAVRAQAEGWPEIALVAVNTAADFWRRHGFSALETPGLAAKLASYGADARYMVRTL